MKGAIFYSSKYGSTAQYARWISEASGLPVFNMKGFKGDLSQYDFLVIGSPIIYYKLHGRKWILSNLEAVESRPLIFFTVSGAPAGEKLDGWIADSLPDHLIQWMDHVALRGRQNPKELTKWDRLMLIIGAMKNPDPVARQEELKGFDFMDKSSIKPVVEKIRQFQLQDQLV